MSNRLPALTTKSPRFLDARRWTASGFGQALRAGVNARRSLAVLVILAMPQFAHAAGAAFPGWTAADAQTAFSDYNSAFYFTSDGNNYDYRVKQGLTDPSYFWVEAEEIEVALDAYNQNPTPAGATIITQLCNGFIKRYGHSWGQADAYDDDLMWATIAFVRAYAVTKNTTFLNDAAANFEDVWNRGYDNTYGGGIWWNVANKKYKVSASNWTFVIAGHLLYEASGNSTYLSQAKTIYGWAYSHLYNPATGRVRDGIGPQGPSRNEYSYNYGTAVAAHTFEGDAKDANLAATFLMRNLTGETYRGVNILPAYGSGDASGDGQGFNGIALRWVGYAYAHGAIQSHNVLRWAQVNVGRAWQLRNSLGLSWNDWTKQTPHGTSLLSWNCSDTVAGMLDIPPPVP